MKKGKWVFLQISQTLTICSPSSEDPETTDASHIVSTFVRLCAAKYLLLSEKEYSLIVSVSIFPPITSASCWGCSVMSCPKILPINPFHLTVLQFCFVICYEKLQLKQQWMLRNLTIIWLMWQQCTQYTWCKIQIDRNSRLHC